MKPLTHTKVTFSEGTLSDLSTIMLCKSFDSLPNKTVMITAETPFHPLDHNWPDQPGDRGWITIKNARYAIVESLTAAFNVEMREFLIDREIKDKKIRRDDSQWLFLVAHLIENHSLPQGIDLSNLEAYLEVDAGYRNALSKIHTACHLAALALNKTTRLYWKKRSENLDSLGNPHLDAEAIVTSKMTEEGSFDDYRCGKSLRKKGFDDLSFFDPSSFKQVETHINQQLSEWCLPNHLLKIWMTPTRSYLNEKREWHCELSTGEKVMIPCGGTHSPLAPSEKIVVDLILKGEGEFTMITKLIQNS